MAGPNNSIYALANPRKGQSYTLYTLTNGTTWKMLPHVASSMSVSSFGDLFITDLGKIYSTKTVNVTELSTYEEYSACHVVDLLARQVTLTDQMEAAVNATTILYGFADKTEMEKNCLKFKDVAEGELKSSTRRVK